MCVFGVFCVCLRACVVYCLAIQHGDREQRGGDTTTPV